MSRGPGRWQRLLLHELYHNPKPPTLGFDGPWISTRSFAATDSEYSAIRRAARGLVTKGNRHFSSGWRQPSGYRARPASHPLQFRRERVVHSSQGIVDRWNDGRRPSPTELEFHMSTESEPGLKDPTTDAEAAFLDRAIASATASDSHSHASRRGKSVEPGESPKRTSARRYAAEG